MSDEHLRELERVWKRDGVAEADAYDQEHQRQTGSTSPPRRDAYRRLYAVLLHRLTTTGDVIFWKDKPSPVPTNKLDVYLNHQRIWPTRNARDLARVRDSIREILRPRPTLGSRVRELIDQYIGPTFPFIDSDCDGQGYILENVGGGLLFAPWGWEPTAGDLIEVQGVQADEGNNTPEDVAALRFTATMLRWACTYGMIEVSFTLVPA